MWIYILINSAKILLIVTFFFDYDLETTPELLEEVQMFIIFLLITVFILGIVYESLTCLW